ncbi:sugar phosphate isomerase/epimerase family protein [Salinicola endophyticus]|uniref:sugar phosphate isomerase/epimerase family protein n=1 Tax=Salinicola endophyticus TaxID=1949083 RepID=UPI000DA1B6EC|nr:TIM barrel protein [Salinicola endophyticus]
MRPLSFSVSTAAYDGYGFDRILASLARCGVRDVEFAFIDGYVEAFTDADLTLTLADDLCREMRAFDQCCRYFSGHIDLGLDNAPERLEARCRFAAALGAECVITNAATLGNRARFLAHAKRLSRIARHHGVRILLENPGNGESNMLDHAGDIPALMAMLDDDTFGINYDCGNLLSHQPERHPESDIEQALPLTDHFHIKPCRRRASGYDFTELGDSDIDEARVLRALMAAERPFSLELPFRLHRDRQAQPWRDRSPLPLDLIEEKLGRSLEWLDNLQ